MLNKSHQHKEMHNKLSVLILILIIWCAFSSYKYKEQSCGQYKIDLDSGFTHKDFYSTGELRYICVDYTTGVKGAKIRKFRFERQYFDKCGNLKLTIRGKGESGCWGKCVVRSKQEKENENIGCDREDFVYPTKSELEMDLKR